MSATSAPFGLRPAFHPTGLDRASALAGGIASGYGSDILKGEPVTLTSSGTLNISTTSGAIQGAFAGVEWTDSTGRRRVSNYWPSGTTYQTGSCVAYWYSDPNIVYEVQADGSVAQTAVGDQANMSNITNGSNVTGLSQATLSSSLAGASGTAQFKIVNIAPYPGNAWGDAYTIVQVQLNQSQYQASVVAF